MTKTKNYITHATQLNDKNCVELKVLLKDRVPYASEAQVWVNQNTGYVNLSVKVRGRPYKVEATFPPVLSIDIERRRAIAMLPLLVEEVRNQVILYRLVGNQADEPVVDTV